MIGNIIFGQNNTIIYVTYFTMIYNRKSGFKTVYDIFLGKSKLYITKFNFSFTKP